MPSTLGQPRWTSSDRPAPAPSRSSRRRSQTARETAAEAPPEGWELRFSKSRNNKPYYFNRATNESVWERPPGPPAAAKMSSGGPAQVRVAHLLVKHTGSRRPSSWRCPTVTLSAFAGTVIAGHHQMVGGN